MKLYFTAASPYARLARIVVVEKQLEGRVEFVLAQTRVPDSPYYAINPSGRVPYLVCDDGTGLEDSALICAYLDHLDGAPAFEAPPGRDGWDLRRLEALARSMLDGLSVWARESNRLEVSTAEQNWSKGRSKFGPLDVMPYEVLRVVPVVHRRDPRCFV